MLHSYLDVFKCLVVSFVLVAAIVIYAYYANMLRAADDPKKREYHPMAILVAPITVPLFFSLAVITFVLTAVLYAGFLFAAYLIIFRKWFFLRWWRKFATTIGDPLLGMSTYLLRLPFTLMKSNPRLVQQESPAGNL